MGFLQFSIVAQLKSCSIIISKTFKSVLIEKSRAGVYRERSWIWIYLPYSVLYPIELGSQYFIKGNIRGNCQKYVFRGIPTAKFHSTLSTFDKHISYTCFRENVLEGIKNIVSTGN